MAIGLVGKVTKKLRMGTSGDRLEFDGATGVTSGSLKDSDGTTIKCDAYLTVDDDGTTYYLPLYDTTA